MVLVPFASIYFAAAVMYVGEVCTTTLAVVVHVSGLAPGEKGLWEPEDYIQNRNLPTSRAKKQNEVNGSVQGRKEVGFKRTEWRYLGFVLGTDMGLRPQFYISYGAMTGLEMQDAPVTSAQNPAAASITAIASYC
jgi:hypothetical protein